MHPANLALWEFLIDRTLFDSALLRNARVLEVGSYDVNGTIRPLFAGARSYLGVDWRPGPGVDLVSLAHEIPLGVGPFQVVASASMLEHDPHWERSLARMAALLDQEAGRLFLTWGAAENQPHECDCAPDGKFHALPAGRVLERLADLGLRAMLLRYEDELHPESIAGGVGLLAVRGSLAVEVAPDLSPLHEADQ